MAEADADVTDYDPEKKKLTVFNVESPGIGFDRVRVQYFFAHNKRQVWSFLRRNRTYLMNEHLPKYHRLSLLDE